MAGASEFEIKYDEFGPEKIYIVYNKKVGLYGFTVIDNTALGKGKGGIRMTPTVSVGEVASLARTMTWKNSLAGIPFGGAKSGIRVNPKQISLKEKYKIVEEFAKALKPICPSLYVAGPDMNMGEKEMRVFANANGRWRSATGKPANMCEGKKCGIPHEYGSTGFGVYHACKVAAEFAGLDLSKATFAVEGFGNVGTFVAKFLSREARFVAVSDSKGAIYYKEGFDYSRLMRVKKEKRTVTAYGRGRVFKNSKKIIEMPVDILITAAVPHLIRKEDINKIKAKIIVEGSNIPVTPDVERVLHKKGILVVPDFVANAGGVISSYIEYIGKTPKYMMKVVERKIVKNTKQVLRRAFNENIMPRDAAMKIAVERVKKAMSKRR